MRLERARIRDQKSRTPEPKINIGSLPSYGENRG